MIDGDCAINGYAAANPCTLVYGGGVGGGGGWEAAGGGGGGGEERQIFLSSLTR